MSSNIWHDIKPERIQEEDFMAVIEIPKGSKNKYELDKETGVLMLDRILHTSTHYPANYGFIPQTLDEDGDELDTLVITAEAIPMGAVIEEARVIGVLNFEDDGEMDHKVICVPADDRHYGKIMSHEELGDVWHKQIEHHFTHYKDLKKPGTTVVEGWGDADEAKRIIHESIERWNNR